VVDGVNAIVQDNFSQLSSHTMESPLTIGRRHVILHSAPTTAARHTSAAGLRFDHMRHADMRLTDTSGVRHQHVPSETSEWSTESCTLIRIRCSVCGADVVRVRPARVSPADGTTAATLRLTREARPPEIG
jgi:hypothetical protein